MRDLQQHPESKFLLLSSRDREQSHRLCIIHLSSLEVQATTSEMVDKTDTHNNNPKKKKTAHTGRRFCDGSSDPPPTSCNPYKIGGK